MSALMKRDDLRVLLEQSLPKNFSDGIDGNRMQKIAEFIENAGSLYNVVASSSMFGTSDRGRIYRLLLDKIEGLIEGI